MSRPCDPHQISRVHIADGFEDDCDELIHKFTQFNTSNYMSFCSLWKEMNFGSVYQGRTSGAEVAELSEELIMIAKHYMVKNTCNFEESVAGLFILYGLLNLQPYVGFALVRIVPKDIPAINRIEVVARRDRRYDVLYILGSVLVQWSEFHIEERERGIEAPLRKYLECFTSIDKLGVRPKGVFFRQNEELDIIRDLGSLTRQYVRAKTCVTDSHADPSLHYINEELPEELSTSLKLIINGIVDDRQNGGREELEPEHYDSVQSIKHKAMSNVVNPMRHLTCVEDRKTKTSPKKKTVSNVASESPDDTKSDSPNKRKLVETSPKRKSSEKPAKKTKHDSDNDSATESDSDLNLEEFQKETAGGSKNPKAAAVHGARESNTGELGVQTDTLPVNIERQSYDFEIVDEILSTNPIDSGLFTEASSSDTTILETYKGLPGNKCFGRSKKRLKKSDKASLLKKVEKRDMKRGHIKNSFKRMGMLAVANFSENGEFQKTDDDNKNDDRRKSDDSQKSDNQGSDNLKSDNQGRGLGLISDNDRSSE